MTPRQMKLKKQRQERRWRSCRKAAVNAVKTVFVMVAMILFGVFVVKFLESNIRWTLDVVEISAILAFGACLCKKFWAIK